MKRHVGNGDGSLELLVSESAGICRPKAARTVTIVMLADSSIF